MSQDPGQWIAGSLHPGCYVYYGHSCIRCKGERTSTRNLYCESCNALPVCQECGEVKEDNNSVDRRVFRLKDIGVETICVNSEPSKNRIMDVLADPPQDLYDIVVSVEDRAGNRFEVERISVFDDRMSEMATMATSCARLVKEKSWRDEENDSVICPICYMDGHGAGACERK